MGIDYRGADPYPPRMPDSYFHFPRTGFKTHSRRAPSVRILSSDLYFERGKENDADGTLSLGVRGTFAFTQIMFEQRLYK